jgi:two-component system CitB family sensor kinase
MRETVVRYLRGPAARARRLSISKQVLVLQLIVAALLTAGGVGVAIQQARSTDFGHARAETLALAETLAAAPGTASAIEGPDPSTVLQPIALGIQHSTGVDFIVVMSPSETRYTHPNPDEIGKHYLGDTAEALSGRAFSEVYTGTLGPSVRSVAPVYGPGHKLVGLISVGITLERLSTLASRQLPLILAIALGAVALVGLGSWALSRRLSKQTLGLGPLEITRLYEHHDAVLHAMHEGLLVLDRRRRILLINDEALRLLDLAEDPTGREVSELGLDPALAALLDSGRDAHDATHLAGTRVLAVNQSKAVRDGRELGTVATLRDHTELRALTGELDSARAFADALSASAHEAANRLHTVVTLIELDRPQDAVRFATTELAASQGLIDRLLTAVGDEAVAALLLGKISQAAERGVELSIGDDTAAPDLPVLHRDLITILGNLIDNAVEAAAGGQAPHRVAVSLRADAGAVTIRVADSGRGIDPKDAELIFGRGWTTKNEPGHGIGLALVRRSVRCHGGAVEVGTDPVLGGAAMTVRLPIPAASVAAPRSAQAHPARAVATTGSAAGRAGA